MINEYYPIFYLIEFKIGNSKFLKYGRTKNLKNRLLQIKSMTGAKNIKVIRAMPNYYKIYNNSKFNYDLETRVKFYLANSSIKKEMFKGGKLNLKLVKKAIKESLKYQFRIAS